MPASSRPENIGHSLYCTPSANRRADGESLLCYRIAAAALEQGVAEARAWNRCASATC